MADLRTCKVCGAEKPLAEFPTYKSKGYSGTRHTCRACWNERWTPVVVAHNRRHYHENIADYRDKHLARVAHRRERFPEKVAATLAVKEAVRRGDLIRQPCQVCGATRADAHHDDYTKPLSVLWLCRTHHARRHAELRRLAVIGGRP